MSIFPVHLVRKSKDCQPELPCSEGSRGVPATLCGLLLWVCFHWAAQNSACASQAPVTPVSTYLDPGTSHWAPPTSSEAWALTCWRQEKQLWGLGVQITVHQARVLCSLSFFCFHCSIPSCFLMSPSLGPPPCLSPHPHGALAGELRLSRAALSSAALGLPQLWG